MRALATPPGLDTKGTPTAPRSSVVRQWFTSSSANHSGSVVQVVYPPTGVVPPTTTTQTTTNTTSGSTTKNNPKRALRVLLLARARTDAYVTDWQPIPGYCRSSVSISSTAGAAWTSLSELLEASKACWRPRRSWCGSPLPGSSGLLSVSACDTQPCGRAPGTRAARHSSRVRRRTGAAVRRGAAAAHPIVVVMAGRGRNAATHARARVPDFFSGVRSAGSRDNLACAMAGGRCG